MHRLKTWPEYFDAIALGLKTFEVRKADRDFRVGDLLQLDEWCPARQDYTGAIRKKQVMYILQGGQFGIEPGYVVMGLGDV